MKSIINRLVVFPFLMFLRSRSISYSIRTKSLKAAQDMGIEMFIANRSGMTQLNWFQ